MTGERSTEPDMYSERPRLEQLAEQLFWFLHAEKSFAEGPTERDVWATTHYYLRDPIGLGVDVDFRDATVNVYFVKLQGGKVPPYGGYMASSGRLRMELALHLRDHLRIEDERFAELFALFRAPGPHGAQWADHVLHAYRDITARYVDWLVQQPLDTLFPPPSNPALCRS